MSNSTTGAHPGYPEMKNKSALIAVLLALTQLNCLIQTAHAQSGEHGEPDRSQKSNRQEQHQEDRQKDKKKNSNNKFI